VTVIAETYTAKTHLNRALRKLRLGVVTKAWDSWRSDADSQLKGRRSLEIGLRMFRNSRRRYCLGFWRSVSLSSIERKRLGSEGAHRSIEARKYREP